MWRSRKDRCRRQLRAGVARGHCAYNRAMPLEQFHPTIQRWFSQRFGEPTEPQREGWPRIRSGRHTLISAPTGTGKTIAGYLWAIDGLARQGAGLKDQTTDALGSGL